MFETTAFSSFFENIRICFCIFRISFVLLVVYKETAVLPSLKANISICHQSLTCILNKLSKLAENLGKYILMTHKHFKIEQCVLLATLICIQLNLKDLFSSVVDFK